MHRTSPWDCPRMRGCASACAWCPGLPKIRHSPSCKRVPNGPSQASKISPIAPFSIDADPAMVNPGGLPKPGGAELTLPNNHLSYALTWFGLGVALAGVFVAYAAKGFARSGAAEKPAMDDADKRARGRPAIIENTP